MLLNSTSKRRVNFIFMTCFAIEVLSSSFRLYYVLSKTLIGRDYFTKNMVLKPQPFFLNTTPSYQDVHQF